MNLRDILIPRRKKRTDKTEDRSKEEERDRDRGADKDRDQDREKDTDPVDVGGQNGDIAPGEEKGGSSDEDTERPRAYALRNWNRLEPRPYSEDFNKALSAELGDPAYMLMKQRALGEFEGHDGGSPVLLNHKQRTSKLHSLKVGNNTLPYDFSLPEEAIVEEIPIPRSIKSAIEFGNLLRHFMNPVHFSAFADTFPIDPQNYANDVYESGSRDTIWLSLAGFSVPDGWVILDGSDASLVNQISLSGSNRASVINGLKTWRAALARRFGVGNNRNITQTNWKPQDIHYSTQSKYSGDAGDVEVTAEQYFGGKMTWHAGQLTSAPSIKRNAGAQHLVVPTVLTFAGMPSARWWGIEEGQVNLSAINPHMTDLTTLMVMEFTLQYGNDWFLIPIDNEIGSWTDISEMVITTSFGDKIDINPADASGWKFMDQTVVNQQTADQRVLMPASSVDIADGPHEIATMFAIDEMNNVAWCIEQTVLSEMGDPTNRKGGQSVYPSINSDPNGEPALPQYQLGTPPPRHWIPFMPQVSDNANSAIVLRRGRAFLKPGEYTTPLSPVLKEMSFPVEVPLDVIPRQGAIVDELYRRTRWLNGRPVVWRARRRKVGKGGIVAANFRFDAFE